MTSPASHSGSTTPHASPQLFATPTKDDQSRIKVLRNLSEENLCQRRPGGSRAFHDATNTTTEVGKETRRQRERQREYTDANELEVFRYDRPSGDVWLAYPETLMETSKFRIVRLGPTIELRTNAFTYDPQKRTVTMKPMRIDSVRVGRDDDSAFDLDEGLDGVDAMSSDGVDKLDETLLIQEKRRLEESLAVADAELAARRGGGGREAVLSKSSTTISSTSRTPRPKTLEDRAWRWIRFLSWVCIYLFIFNCVSWTCREGFGFPVTDLPEYLWRWAMKMLGYRTLGVFQEDYEPYTYPNAQPTAFSNYGSTFGSTYGSTYESMYEEDYVEPI